MMYSRSERVLGNENIEKLKKSHIAVLGVGGVGGFVVEMLARLGVGALTIVDFDKVDVSNINRQIIALNSTIGKNKVDVFKARIADINSACFVNAKCEKLQKDTIGKILNEKYDYVIDAIDDVKAKVEVAKYCQDAKIPLISSMGTGNRYKIPKFEVCDISKTSYDKLARKLRKMLKDEGIYHVDVAYTKEPTERTESLGSIVYYPLSCAGVIVSFVVNKILEHRVEDFVSR